MQEFLTWLQNTLPTLPDFFFDMMPEKPDTCGAIRQILSKEGPTSDKTESLFVIVEIRDISSQGAYTWIYEIYDAIIAARAEDSSIELVPGLPSYVGVLEGPHKYSIDTLNRAYYSIHLQLTNHRRI